MNVATNRVDLTPWIVALDTVVRITLFSRRGSHCCSARGGVAAEGTLCMHAWHGTTNVLVVESSNTFQRPASKMPSQASEIFSLFFFPKAPLIS